MSEQKIINYKTIWVIGQPIGGISHVWEKEELEYSYCQAMVKYE